MKISKALVFDIKRFAIHDGSGLRTTVFFKGCPLRCLWCQNPEGLNTQRQVIYFKNKCIHCRCCQQFKEQINYQNDRNTYKDFLHRQDYLLIRHKKHMSPVDIHQELLQCMSLLFSKFYQNNNCHLRK